MYCYVTAIIALLLSILTFSQTEGIYKSHNHYTTEDGLPQSYVSQIVQDEDGFIWIATLDGLARYDGKKFVYFNIDSEGEKRLSSSQIYDIYLNKEGKLWVYHFNHIVDKLDPKTLAVERNIEPIAKKSFDEFQLGFNWINVREIVNDSRDNWFGGDSTSFKLYDSSNIKLGRLFEDSFVRTTPVVHAFCEDRMGRLWIMTNDGLEVSDKSWTSFKKINIPSSFNFSPGKESFRPLLPLDNGKVLFAYANRLFLYNEHSKDFKEIALPLLPLLENDYIGTIVLDNFGRAVFKYKGHIFRLEDDDSATCLWRSPTKDQFKLNCLFIDRSNTLWVGVNTGGLYRIDLNTPAFQSFPYKKNFLVDILQRDLGVKEVNIPENWMNPGWSYGMRYLYSREGLLITHESYGYGNARKIYQLRNGQLDPLLLKDEYFKYIIGLAESRENLWALDIEGNAFKWLDQSKYPEEFSVKYIPDTGVERLSDMVSDEQSQWVIATKNKLYELLDGKIINEFDVGPTGSSLIDLAMDPKDPDIFWIASLGGGLIKWNKRLKKTDSVYTKSAGLPSNSIGSVVPDSLGNLWLGTFKGISCFDTKTQKFNNYTTKDGIIESEFNRHHGFILPDGRIALGATKGYSIFDPEVFTQDEYNPKVVISEIQIDDEIITFSGSGLIKKPLSELTNLSLDYKSNSLRFELAALQFNDPSSNQYRYQLEGFNESWINNGNQRIIRFDNLPPGKYTLKLNASNTDAIWSDQVKTLQINISPPPWLSWWAYCLYIFIALGLIIWYWRSYKKRLHRQQEIEFNKREAARLKEIDGIKARFFSNITHEFRTPLTLILSPLEKQLRENKYPPEVQKLLTNNYKQGSHLLNLVNQLLDISKLESGKMQVHKSVGDLSSFVRVNVEQFRQYAHDKGIELLFDNGGIEGNYLFEKVHWEKIIMNLLSNALKFTELGAIKLSLKEIRNNDSTSAICIDVKDSGIGIPPEQLSRLFDRFYQVDDTDTRDQEGTGIGLSLVKELTELLKGKITVESEPGKGTIFHVELPVERIQQIQEESYQEVLLDSEALFLVVEDNQELRQFVVDTLSNGRNVISAGNGKEAWDLIIEKLPDVIISDVMMPEMNGYELCNKVKNDIRTAHISFLLLTAKTAQESKEAGLIAGADDYLTKPFHSHELELRIDNLVRQQQNLRNHLRIKFLSQRASADLQNVGDEFISQLYAFLEEHYDDSSLGVMQVADSFAMSKSTLNRKLRSILNVSVNTLIKQYRLQKAKELLKTGRPVSQVGYAVGFESPSYFAQSFKEFFGKTPSEYAEQTV